MLLEITKKTGLAKVNAALKMLKPGKQFDAKKHCGKVKWDIDGLNYQKSIRNEWDLRYDRYKHCHWFIKW